MRRHDSLPQRQYLSVKEVTEVEPRTKEKECQKKRLTFGFLFAYYYFFFFFWLAVTLLFDALVSVVLSVLENQCEWNSLLRFNVISNQFQYRLSLLTIINHDHRRYSRARALFPTPN